MDARRKGEILDSCTSDGREKERERETFRETGVRSVTL